LLGAVLPFGVGFLLRKILGGSGKPTRQVQEVPVIVMNEALIRDWVLPRALLVQRAIAKHYPMSLSPIHQ